MATASELADEWREERLEFNDALVQHIEENLGLVPDLGIVMVLTLAIGFANLGQLKKHIDLPDGRNMTANDIISEFGIRPFLEQPEQD